jgi:sugar phosphate isomerase/epimerase
MNQFSLAHLTALGLPPPELVRLAARTGYGSVGLRLIAVTGSTSGYPLMNDRAMMAATKSALADTGLRVLDIEFVRITPETDVGALEPFVAAGAELGARHLIAAPYDADLGRLADRLAALAEMAASYRVRPVLEFFPWTPVPNLATAVAVVGGTGRDDVGILIDALHFDRSDSRLEDLERIPPTRLPYVHLCDAPVQLSYTEEELLYAGRAERLPPGHGGIDLSGILSRVPKTAAIALEVPMTTRAVHDGYESVARRALRAAEQVLRPAEEQGGRRYRGPEPAPATR